MTTSFGLFTPAKILVLALMGCSLFYSGFTVSDWRSQAVISGMVADAADNRERAIADAQAIEHLGDIAADAIMAEYALRQAADAESTDEITQEVIQYVQAESAAGGSAHCLDSNWVRIHDLAATGSMSEAPDPAGYADGDATGVTPGEALSNVTANYGTCNSTRDQLITLQQWVADTLAPYREPLPS